MFCAAEMAPVPEPGNRYGVSGKAVFDLTVDNEGQITRLKQRGDFVDTPTGSCIEKAVKGITFPKTRKKAMSFTYPLVLG